MNSGGCRSHRAVTGPMSFKKLTTFCRKIVLPEFWGTWLYQSTLFDLANTVLAKQKLCRDHMHELRGLENPSSCHWSDEFQKITTFCRKIVLPVFWGTWLYQSTLFDLANTVLAKQKLCRDHMHELRGLENPSSCHWSDEFQKITTFCRKIVLPVFWGTWLYQSTLFDLANTILASKGPVETICKNSVGYRTHRAVTGPMSFKKLTTFCRKIVLPEFWGTWL